MSKPLLVILALLATLGLTGCATGYFGYLRVDTIALQHTELTGVGTIPGANHITVNVKVNDIRTSPAGFSSDWNRAQVGHQTNGFGEPVAPTIVVIEPVERTLKKATEDELSLRGFRIGDNAGINIEMDIRHFYNEFKAPLYELIAEDSVADLAIEVRIKLANGKELYSRQIAVQSKVKFVISPGGRDAKAALDQALDKGINMLFSDDNFISALLGNRSDNGD